MTDNQTPNGISEAAKEVADEIVALVEEIHQYPPVDNPQNPPSTVLGKRGTSVKLQKTLEEFAEAVCEECKGKSS